MNIFYRYDEKKLLDHTTSIYNEYLYTLICRSKMYLKLFLSYVKI